jgi:HK97 family phage major capsid protein
MGAVDAASGHDSLDEVTTDDIATLVAALPEYARPNAKFYCSGVADAVIFGALQMAAGGNSAENLASGWTRRFYGFPVVVSQVCPSVLTATYYNNKVMVILGDLSMSSTLGNRRDIRIEILSELYASNDQIGIKGTQRFDIVNHNVGTTSVAGPVVGLVGCT